MKAKYREQCCNDGGSCTNCIGLPSINEFTHNTREPIEVKGKHNFYILFFILLGLFTIGYILDGYEDKPETRYVPHIWEGKGYIIDMEPVFINEHCKK